MNQPGWRGGGCVEIWKEFEQNEITHSAAHHLMAIDDLVQRYGYARVSDVARRLSITRGSVSITLQPLKKAGLVLQDENRHLRLSERGQELVAAIRTKRRLLQRLLAEVLGIDPQQAEIDACKMEHLMSNPTGQRLVSFLRYLDTDPQAREFLAAWRRFDAQCPHQPDACPSCAGESRCLADSVRS